MSSLLTLAGAFAVFVQLTVVFTGRMPAGALVTALSAGALAVAVLATPRPIAALRTIDRPALVQACAGGLLAVAGAPATIAALRLSDAPAGSIVVFWVAGGWAAVAACGAAALAFRHRRFVAAGWSLTGALLALAGVAGVVSNWERPSSFSPWVRFAPAEMGILFGGALLLVGGLLVVRAARTARMDAALSYAAASALAASAAVWAVEGVSKGWGSLSEQPLVVAVAALAWGVVWLAWPATLKSFGQGKAAAALAVTPVLLSGLILVEQVVGVAGPQPLVVFGVAAGSLFIAVAVVALMHSDAASSVSRPRLFVALAVLPAVLGVLGLFLPALTAHADVSVTGGSFSGSWTMIGAESVAGWSALALAVLVAMVAIDARPLWPAVTALAAVAAWPWLADVPTHVWSTALAPEIQQYYGTEYGSISFTAVPNMATLAAIVMGAAFLLGIIAMRRDRTDLPDAHVDDGGL